MIWIFNSPRAYPAYYEKYYDTFDFYNGREAWAASIASVPVEAVHLFCVHWLHLEVVGGGFANYFWNSTGTTVPEAIEGFAAIGMPEVSEIVGQAMERIGRPYPVEKSDREALLESKGDALNFDDLDTRFYDLADTKQFFRKVPKFVPFAERYALDAASRGKLQHIDKSNV